MASSRNTLVCILAALFGISSWIEINGLWVELPLLISHLPEGGQLASYIVVITQLANIGPILYSVLRKRCLSKEYDKYLIHGTLFVGTMSSLLLIFFWSKTTLMGSSMRSLSFLMLTFFLAFVDCTSSVLYMPFMSNFKSAYLIPYIVGEGLSGLIPAIVALGQGVGGNPDCRDTKKYDNATGQYNVTVTPVYHPPRFSIETFFIFLTCMLLVSWISFVLLNTLPVALMEQGSDEKNEVECVDAKSKDTIYVANSSSSIDDYQVRTSSDPVLKKVELSRSKYKALLLMQGIICCFSNGVLPAIQTYSCLPYGNIAYHLSVTLSNIANPLSSFVAFYKWTIRTDIISGLTLIGAVSAAYILSTAVLSPHSPLVGTTAGEVLLILFWLLFTGVLSYVKACIASALRQYGGHQALFYCGVFTQAGSFIGAVVMFALVNFTSIFVFYVACQ